MQGSSRTSRLRSRGIEFVQVGEEVIGRLVHSHLAAGNVLVDFPLTPLPVFGTEPGPGPVCLSRDQPDPRAVADPGVPCRGTVGGPDPCSGPSDRPGLPAGS